VNRLVRTHLYTAYIALFLGGIFGLLQALARAPSISLPLPLSYYQVLTVHGVLMALVFTTFFIIGFVLFGTTRALARPLAHPRLAWAGYVVMLVGTVAVAVSILVGQATVLYTFYAPLQAHPAFYLGATLLVIGTWVMAVEVFSTYRSWRATSPEARLPLVVHGILTTLILWLIASAGVAVLLLFQLIPWSLGLVERIDPLLARDLFWYFGHPLVYFWLLPAYIIWYAFMPRLAGGKLFSDPLARLAFILLLLFSTPVGFHHQFMDPGIALGWKYLHTINTMAVTVPSLMTAFTLAASLELAGRARGGRGLLAWIGRLPWGEPTFAPLALAMILFAFGGFSGLVNASYNLNAVVHNTVWVVGHFHLTVGTAAALTFMGTSYWLLPVLTRKPLWGRRLALAQAYLWFGGMVLFSGSMHLAGLLGSPRRTSNITYGGDPVAASWLPHINLAAVGGVLLFLSILLFTLVVVMTLASSRRQETPVPLAEALSGPEGAPRLLDRWAIWIAIAIFLVLVGYAVPTAQLALSGAPGSPGFVTW
jgi:cytochrome c oxidase subunit 1